MVQSTITITISQTNNPLSYWLDSAGTNNRKTKDRRQKIKRRKLRARAYERTRVSWDATLLARSQANLRQCNTLKGPCLIDVKTTPDCSVCVSFLFFTCLFGEQSCIERIIASVFWNWCLFESDLVEAGRSRCFFLLSDKIERYCSMFLGVNN